MELLITALVEFAAVLISGLAVLFGLVFASFLELAAGLAVAAGDILALFVPSRRERAAASPPSPRRKKLGKILAWGGAIGLGLLLLLAAAIAVANAFFFDQTFRLVAGGIADRAGIAVDFANVSGSLWRGRVAITGLSARRAGHAVDDFDIAGGDVTFDLSVASLLRRKIVFEDLSVSGFAGSWTRTGKPAGGTKRRDFRIERLELRDIAIAFSDLTRPIGRIDIDVAVDRFRMTPLRREWAVYDLLFNSEGSGRLDGRPFASERSEGRQSFRLENAPVRWPAAYIGGPLAWFDKGAVDIAIANEMREDKVLMSWSLVFRDFHLSPPEGAKPRSRMAAKPITALLNRKSERLPLEFELEMGKDEIRYKTSAELDVIATLAAKAVRGATERLSRTFDRIIPD